MTARTVLLTGAAGGLGAATARLLRDRGFRVIAADLPSAALDELADEPGIGPLALDVTDPASVQGALDSVSEHVDGLDGVVCFAGVLAIGSMVELDPAVVERVLAVNVLGTYRVNHAFFPLVLEKRGRIVNISSEVGWQQAAPFNGAYAMSKHAVEAYSDTLRREAMFLGVDVIKVQPGPFKTGMVDSITPRFRRAAEESQHFGGMLRRLERRVAVEASKGHDPRLVAEAVLTALTARRPKLAYSVKPDPARSALSRLPARAVDRILRLALGKP